MFLHIVLWATTYLCALDADVRDLAGAMRGGGEHTDTPDCAVRQRFCRLCFSICCGRYRVGFVPERGAAAAHVNLYGESLVSAIYPLVSTTSWYTRNQS